MKPLVILHGWGSQLSRWQTLKRLLTQAGFQVYLPPLPGFTPTNQLDRPFSTADYSDWLNHFCQQKKFSEIYLLGHSFGGQIAIHFTAHHPQKVSRLILIDSAGIRNKFNLKKLLFLPLAKLGKLIFSLPLLSSLALPFKKLLYQLTREQDYFQASPLMKQTMKIILKQDQQLNLKKIKTPALLLWGNQDRYTPLADASLMHQLLRSSKLVTFESAGHGLPFQQPQLVSQAVIKFLSTN